MLSPARPGFALLGIVLIGCADGDTGAASTGSVGASSAGVGGQGGATGSTVGPGGTGGDPGGGGIGGAGQGGVSVGGSSQGGAGHGGASVGGSSQGGAGQGGASVGGSSQGGAGQGGAAGAGGAATGGGGAGGGNVCAPNSTIACYTGPNSTLGVGICAAGEATCTIDGSGYGPCVGDVVPQQETCAVWGDEDCDGTTNEACPVTGCAKALGGPVSGVAVDGAGNVVIVGTFSSTMDLGGGPLVPSGSSGFVAKFDSSCNHVWSMAFVSPMYVAARAVAVDPFGNLFVTGSLQGTGNFAGASLTAVGMDDAYLVKLAPDGSLAWAKRFGDGGVDQFGLGVAAAADGAVAVTGQFAPGGMQDFGGGPVSGYWFAASFASDGTHLWSLATDGGRGGAVAIDDAGNTILVGALSGTANFGSGPISNVPPGEDPVVAKLSSSGVPLWVKAFPGDTKWFFAGAAVSVGDPVVTGSFAGSLDVGGTVLTSAGGDDGFVAKLASADGATKWAKGFGSASTQVISAVASHVSGDIVVGGTFNGTVSFGGASLSASAIGWNAFLARLSPSGSHVQSAAYPSGFSQLVAVATGVAGEQAIGGEVAGGSVDFGFGVVSTGGKQGVFARIVP